MIQVNRTAQFYQEILNSLDEGIIICKDNQIDFTNDVFSNMTMRLQNQHATKDIIKYPFLKIYRMDETVIGDIGKSDYSLKELLSNQQSFVNDKIFEIEVRK